MRSVFVSTLLGVTLVLATAAAALAAPPHEHYLTTPSGKTVTVNPAICENEPLLHEPVLHNLHAHFHMGAPTQAFATNPITFSFAGCP